MRRASAILLIGIFSLPLIGPALFASDSVANLPACCRRLGKHHCATVAADTAPSSGPVVQVSRCSVFPVARALPPTRSVSLPGIIRLALALPISHSTVYQQPQSLCPGSYSCAHPKRGPPSRLS